MVRDWLNERYEFPEGYYLEVSPALDQYDATTLVLEETLRYSKDGTRHAGQMEILAFEGVEAVVVRTLDKNGEMPRIDVRLPDSFQQIAEQLEPFFFLHNAKKK